MKPKLHLLRCILFVWKVFLFEVVLFSYFGLGGIHVFSDLVLFFETFTFQMLST